MKITIDLGSGKTDAAALEDIRSAVKRSLMPFDQLNRLRAKSSGSGGKGKTEGSSMKETFQNLGKAMLTFGEKVAGLKTQVQELITESGIIDEILADTPPRLELICTGTTDLSRALMDFSPASVRAVQALADLDGQTLYTAGLMEMLPFSATSAAEGMKLPFGDMKVWLAEHVSVPVADICGSLFTGLEIGARDAWSNTKSVFSETGSFLKTTFSNAWDGVLSVFSKTDDTMAGFSSSMLQSIKDVANKIISGINSAVIEPFSGLNAAMQKLKSFKLGAIEPFKNLAFNVSVPKIPFLASGAVLPANKPFMAVVGDQKHGTNVEAPLSTIREAVADVMTGVLEAEMAGHNATVGVLTQILEAVLGIRLDENAIGAAADRYARRQSMITGGF